MKELNGYLLKHPTLLLSLMWGFTAAAVGVGVVLIFAVPNMGYFKFLACIAIPAAIALYLRLLYSKVQERKKEERKAQKAAENETRYQHKKKKR